MGGPGIAINIIIMIKPRYHVTVLLNLLNKIMKIISLEVKND